MKTLFEQTIEKIKELYFTENIKMSKSENKLSLFVSDVDFITSIKIEISIQQNSIDYAIEGIKPMLTCTCSVNDYQAYSNYQLTENDTVKIKSLIKEFEAKIKSIVDKKKQDAYEYITQPPPPPLRGVKVNLTDKQ